MMKIKIEEVIGQASRTSKLSNSQWTVFIIWALLNDEKGRGRLKRFLGRLAGLPHYPKCQCTVFIIWALLDDKKGRGRL